jgi:hypothetical protein
MKFPTSGHFWHTNPRGLPGRGVVTGKIEPCITQERLGKYRPKCNTGCIKKKVIELQRAIIRELLSV